MQIETAAGPFVVARSVIYTSGSTSIGETTTEPSGVGVHNLVPSPGGLSKSMMRVIVGGTGDDNAAGSIIVAVWNSWRGTSGTRYWTPTRLCEIDFTLSGATGSDSTLGFSRYADTLVQVMPAASVPGLTIHSNADDAPAFFILDLYGAEKVQVAFTVSSATGANALLRFF